MAERVFDVRPNEGVGPVNFEIHIEELLRVLELNEAECRTVPSWDRKQFEVWINQGEFLAELDLDKKLTSLSFQRDAACLMLAGTDLFSLSKQSLRSFLKQNGIAFSKRAQGYICKQHSLGFDFKDGFLSSRPVSITIADRGAYLNATLDGWDFDIQPLRGVGRFRFGMSVDDAIAALRLPSDQFELHEWDRRGCGLSVEELKLGAAFNAERRLARLYFISNGVHPTLFGCDPFEMRRPEIVSLLDANAVAHRDVSFIEEARSDGIQCPGHGLLFTFYPDKAADAPMALGATELGRELECVSRLGRA